MQQVFRNATDAAVGASGSNSTTTLPGFGGLVSETYYYDTATTPRAELIVEKVSEFEDYMIYVEGRNRPGDAWVATLFTDFNEVSGAATANIARLSKANEANHLSTANSTISVTFDTMPEIRVRIARAQTSTVPAESWVPVQEDICFYPKLRLDGSPYTRVENAETGSAPGVTGLLTVGIDANVLVPYDNDAGGVTGALGTGAGEVRSRPKMTIYTPHGTPPPGGWPIMLAVQHSGFGLSDPLTGAITPGSVDQSSRQITSFLQAGMAVAVTSHIGYDSPFPGGAELPYWLTPTEYASRIGQNTGETAIKSQREVQFAIQWLRAYGQGYDLNPDFLFMTGRSGGGALCYWAAAAPSITYQDSADPQRRQSCSVDGVVASIAPFHFAGYDPVGGNQDIVHLQANTLDNNIASGLLTSDLTAITQCSPSDFMFNGVNNPGCRSRIGRTPFYLMGTLANSGGVPAPGPIVDDGLYFNLPIGSVTATQANYNVLSGAQGWGQGTKTPGLTLVLDEAHTMWEQLQLMYMLRSLSREDGQHVQSGAGQGQLFHDYYSQFTWVNATGDAQWNNTGNEDAIADGSTAGAWTNKFAAGLVTSQRSSLALQYENAIPWILRAKPDCPVEVAGEFTEGQFNVWIGEENTATGATSL